MQKRISKRIPKKKGAVKETLLSCFTHLQNLELDEANSFLYTSDETYLFKSMELVWLNPIFYNNWKIEIKTVDIQNDTATVFVDMAICNVYRLSMEGLNVMKESGKDYRKMTKKEIIQEFYEMAQRIGQ